MKKIFFFTTLIIFGLTIAALAGTSTPFLLADPDNTKVEYKTFVPYDLIAHGTDNEFTGTTWIFDDTFLLSSLSLINKYDFGDSVPWENNNADSTFTLNSTTASKTGEWTYASGSLLDSDPGNDFQLYFSIKAANGQSGGGWDLFSMRSDWDIGKAVTWSTLNDFFKTDLDNLGDHDISHISFWKGNIPNAVPEPATLMLMGFGLIGLAKAGRKKTKNKI
ncbi:MAG: PEP-CTERM sorting domain-containing protein [Desulfobacula sp.]|nr:PEP-CTERM sorting domain-containing protein [Desulfobacula sp.]